MENIHAEEMDLAKGLFNGLSSIKGVRVYPSIRQDQSVPILLCNVEGMDPEDVSAILDGDFGIATRAGLHCAPLVHQDLGTSPKGGVRFSLGPFNTAEEVEHALGAMDMISQAK
jgi:selenocysteine lyase/cysteine desulfurase